MAAQYLVDISNNQGRGGAAALSDPSVLGGYGKGIEGLGFRDPDYHAFYDAAKAVHKPFGPYLFLRPGQDARAQARALLAFTKPVPGDLQPVVDSEVTDSLGMGAVAHATYAALDELRLHGFQSILYASTSWLQTICADEPRLKEFGAWQAEYGPVLHRIPGLRAVMWQFTDRMVVAKGRLRVDGDKLLVKSIDALRIPKTATVKHPTPPKPPATPVAKKKPVLHAVTTTTTTSSGSNVTVTYTPVVSPVPPDARPKPKPAAKKPAAPKKPKRTYYTLKKNVPLKTGQTVGYVTGKGYYAKVAPKKKPPATGGSTTNKAA